MPWPSRVVRNASLPLVFATLSLGVVVSCVSITRAVPTETSTPPPIETSTVAAPPSSTATPTALPLATTPAPPELPGVGASASPLAPASSDGRLATPSPAGSPSAAPTPTPTPSPASTLSSTPAETARTAQVRGRRLNAATRRRLDRILRNVVTNKGVAGVQAAVHMPGGDTWIGTAGNAEFSPDRRIQKDTLFSIASVTKTFIAALILQLAEEGKLSLDETFGAYEPNAPRASTATIRQLLSHTSGIYNYFEHPRYASAAKAWLRQKSAPGLRSREHRWTFEEIMSMVKPGYFKAGKGYHYSNTNYVILGRVAEAAGGAPLHQLLRERFFEPLGLKHTVYQPAERPPADAAHGHWDVGSTYSDHTRDARVIPFMAAVSVADAAGAIASTAGDLAIWADALYGGDVLSARSLREMTTILLPGTYGLGTDVAFFAGHRGFGHRGGLRGFESSMWYFPDSGVSVVLLSNQGNWLTDVPMGKLVRAVLGNA